MDNYLNIEQRLGDRILWWILTIALLCGFVISAVQVFIDARRVSTNLENQASETIAMVRDAATQAVFNIDADLAHQVTKGLLAVDAIHLARITHPDGEPLGGQDRPLRQTAYRPLTDAIFEADRKYQTALTRESSDIVYGYLEVHYDTALSADTWLSRSAVTFASGLATAAILGLAVFFVFHLLLARPMINIIRSIKSVDPEHPDGRLIAIPKGHQRDEMGLWVNATNNLLVSIADSQERHREAEIRANRLSQYDQLTGLPRRETFMEMLEQEIALARKDGQVLSLMVCGIDDFKSVNEQCGFRVGDLILQKLSDRLSSTLAGSRFSLSRLGSDQFAILEKGIQNSFQAAESADQVLTCFSTPVSAENQTVSMSATVGVSMFPSDADEADRLLQSAEQTMTLAKQSGHNHLQFYVASIDQEIRDRKLLERDLSEALAKGEFHLVYQPQVDLETRRIIGAEALIRWNHPTRGFVPPDHFIPVAEANGAIVEIGQWVLEQACWQASQWAAKGIGVRIAVNLSAVQLQQADVVEDILDTLHRHNVAAGRLELEVTETSFMTNLADAVDKLHQLNQAGISIAVDDFGTGYSSLTYLKKMPVQHLKIDKQFIRDLLLNEEDTRIANTIIDLGRSLNLSVVAEGVETAEQEYYLTQRGCRLAQGYYFSKPIPAREFETFVHSFHEQFAENNV
ncbi:EAL domain-containing protein [Marinobacter salinisoli]|uniref:EAL domain-containing protein n=1 Tax=Marinobacter salinisoli TaxID=2769486 RepID=A0ABX7MTJ9_9GAMM|nr:GGDEF domain-containing phosphodiesterase [Marinobacter salinisoli]QSP94436.1 EAL domain-containing protein [Marinobacter salinisoli]